MKSSRARPTRRTIVALAVSSLSLIVPWGGSAAAACRPNGDVVIYSQDDRKFDPADTSQVGNLTAALQTDTSGCVTYWHVITQLTLVSGKTNTVANQRLTARYAGTLNTAYEDIVLKSGFKNTPSFRVVPEFNFSKQYAGFLENPSSYSTALTRGRAYRGRLGATGTASAFEYPIGLGVQPASWALQEVPRPVRTAIWHKNSVTNISTWVDVRFEIEDTVRGTLQGLYEGTDGATNGSTASTINVKGFAFLAGVPDTVSPWSTPPGAHADDDPKFSYRASNQCWLRAVCKTDTTTIHPALQQQWPLVSQYVRGVLNEVYATCHQQFCPPPSLTALGDAADTQARISAMVDYQTGLKALERHAPATVGINSVRKLFNRAYAPVISGVLPGTTGFGAYTTSQGSQTHNNDSASATDSVEKIFRLQLAAARRNGAQRLIGLAWNPGSNIAVIPSDATAMTNAIRDAIVASFTKGGVVCSGQQCLPANYDLFPNDWKVYPKQPGGFPFQYLACWNSARLFTKTQPGKCVGRKRQNLAVPGSRGGPAVLLLSADVLGGTQTSTSQDLTLPVAGAKSARCSIDGDPFSPCWPNASGTTTYTVTGLAIGDHTLQVELTFDDASVELSDIFGWTYRTAGVPQNVTGPAATTTASTASFSWTATAGATSFMCSLDGATETTCASPKSYTGLAVGTGSDTETHTFSVVGISAGAKRSAQYSEWETFTPTPITDFNWTEDHGPYVLDSQFVVPAGTVLTIGPGVEILMGSAAGITVNGRLDIQGTADAPVQIHSIASQDVPGDWTGLTINGAPTASTCALPTSTDCPSSIAFTDITSPIVGVHVTGPGNNPIPVARVSDSSVVGARDDGIWAQAPTTITRTRLEGNGYNVPAGPGFHGQAIFVDQTYVTVADSALWGNADHGIYFFINDGASIAQSSITGTSIMRNTNTGYGFYAPTPPTGGYPLLTGNNIYDNNQYQPGDDPSTTYRPQAETRDGQTATGNYWGDQVRRAGDCNGRTYLQYPRPFSRGGIGSPDIGGDGAFAGPTGHTGGLYCEGSLGTVVPFAPAKLALNFDEPAAEDYANAAVPDVSVTGGNTVPAGSTVTISATAANEWNQAGVSWQYRTSLNHGTSYGLAQTGSSVTITAPGETVVQFRAIDAQGNDSGWVPQTPTSNSTAVIDFALEPPADNQLRFILFWTTSNDHVQTNLDMQVTEPGGSLISKTNPGPTSTGGLFRQDASCVYDGESNVYWPIANGANPADATGNPVTNTGPLYTVTITDPWFSGGSHHAAPCSFTNRGVTISLKLVVLTPNKPASTGGAYVTNVPMPSGSSSLTIKCSYIRASSNPVTCA